MASNIKGQLQSAMGSVNAGIGVMAGMKQMANKQAEAEQAKQQAEQAALEQEEAKTIKEYTSYATLGDRRLPVTPDTVTRLTNAAIDLRNNDKWADYPFSGPEGDMNAPEYADELSNMANEYQRRLTSYSEQARVQALTSMLDKRQIKSMIRKYGFGGKN